MLDWKCHLQSGEKNDGMGWSKQRCLIGAGTYRTAWKGRMQWNYHSTGLTSINRIHIPLWQASPWHCGSPPNSLPAKEEFLLFLFLQPKQIASYTDGCNQPRQTRETKEDNHLTTAATRHLFRYNEDMHYSDAKHALVQFLPTLHQCGIRCSVYKGPISCEK